MLCARRVTARFTRSFKVTSLRGPARMRYVFRRTGYQCSSFPDRFTEDSECTDSPAVAVADASAAFVGISELERLVSMVTCFRTLPRYESRGRRPPARLPLEGTKPLLRTEANTLEFSRT